MIIERKSARFIGRIDLASAAFEEGERCILSLSINEIEYSGEATWSVEDGFVAELHAYHQGSILESKDIPAWIPFEIGKGKRALMVGPILTRAGGMTIAHGRPVTTSIKIRCNTIIHEAPWDVPERIHLSSISVSCDALSLWYGDETADIQTDSKLKKTIATFSVHDQEYTTNAGLLKVGLGYSVPGMPKRGKYHFNTSVQANLEFSEAACIENLPLWAEKIEGFFDTLTGFPNSERSVRVQINGEERTLPVSCSKDFYGGASENHPFKVFLGKSDKIDIERSFNAYLAHYKKLKLLHQTSRYLSGERLRIPEGFLTACNLIESLGKDGAAPNQDLMDAADEMQRLVSEHPDFEAAWKTVDGSLLKFPSFNACCKALFEQANQLGCEVSLSGGKVRDARARYRHDLRDLKQEDIDIMIALTGFAWVMGLVELCRKIEIDDSLIAQALSRDVFHSMRGTNIMLWSKPYADKVRSRSAAALAEARSGIKK